jgi:ectoine hydroxylase-related dioxygenase (phytanoyl-CoA dioxygenase family)
MTTFSSPSLQTKEAFLSEETVQEFRKNGFVRIPEIISKEEVIEFREAALAAQKRIANASANDVFTQLLNVWRHDAKLKKLTLHPRIGAAAEQLAGVPMRLLHDQILIKQPHSKNPTTPHQDKPYESLDHAHWYMTAWVALCDVSVERGCMTFIPGQHYRDDIENEKVDPATFKFVRVPLFERCPDLAWKPRVTIPLRAGDCTFHHGLTPHMANNNTTDEPRIAHLNLFTDATSIYTCEKPNLVLGHLNLKPGQLLEGEMFPLVRDFASR